MKTLIMALQVTKNYLLSSKLSLFGLILFMGMFSNQSLLAQQPPVIMHWSPANPQPEDELTVSFTMGTFENQASDVYQIDESFSYANRGVQLEQGLTDTISLDGDGSWFANDQSWSGYMIVDTANKKIILKMERPSNDPRSGYETLAAGGEVIVVIEDLWNRMAQTTSFQTKVYPNPSRGFFTIESIDGTPIEYISVMSVSGQVVKEFSVNQPVFKVNLSDLPSQLYMVKITGEDGRIEHHQWIKQ